MNKKQALAASLLFVFLVVFIPLASSSPDGLESVAASLGVAEPEPIWQGIMGDYSVMAFGDSYISTLTAGIFGTALVLLATLALGATIAKRSKPDTKTT